MSVVGVLPMAGTGSRLGLPFHKALAPTFTERGIRPLYWHSWKRLEVVADDIVFVVSNGLALPEMPGQVMVKPERGELPSSIALVARNVRDHDILIVSLPDTIWFPADGCKRLLEPHRPTLGLFDAGCDVLDTVEQSGGMMLSVAPHHEHGGFTVAVRGWGVFAAEASALRALSDAMSLGSQLLALNPALVYLGDRYYDLGTPERYMRYMDQR